MHSITVELCVRGIIHFSMEVQSGWIGDPSCIASSVKIPSAVDGKVISRDILEGYWYILARQPCLCKRGIQPARVNILDGEITSSTPSLPLYMSVPYGADYDGDEMLLYPVYYSELVKGI